ncbi:hypothetical protein JJJ17_07680 [Paracoccus caeni]|uniref:Uncharacterized protein n=1 Tax=Paracoccus caeni TaxID=657651 RepID=A0A934SEB3_9RHOB|nr:hypothetical protein [Paracoccus caeni]MBK4215800.1 hypothetical protein [Paracoccus caeni]
MAARRAVMTEAQARRFIRAARAEDPRAVVEIVTEAGTIRIMPEPTVAPTVEQEHDKRKPIPWT